MTFALGEMYKVRREYANGIEASAFTFHVLGSRLYNGFVPRYYILLFDFSPESNLSTQLKTSVMSGHLMLLFLCYSVIQKPKISQTINKQTNNRNSDYSETFVF